MRFLADENVSRVVVSRLREAGLHVMEIPDEQRGSRDEIVLDIALSGNCILSPRTVISANW